MFAILFLDLIDNRYSAATGQNRWSPIIQAQYIKVNNKIYLFTKKAQREKVSR
jgi:hypothetical protein